MGTWFNDYYIDAKTLEDVKHNALRAELEKAVMTPEDIDAKARKKVRADKAQAIAAMKASDAAFKASQARNAKARAELRANDAQIQEKNAQARASGDLFMNNHAKPTLEERLAALSHPANCKCPLCN